MKLAEIDSGKDRLLPTAQAMLKALGLTELDSFTPRVKVAGWEGGGPRQVAIATDAGLWLGQYGPDPEVNGDIRLAGELTSWSEVGGARLVSAGWPNAGEDASWSLRLVIESPAFDVRVVAPIASDAYRMVKEFGRTVMHLQAGWQRRKPADTSGETADADRPA